MQSPPPSSRAPVHGIFLVMLPILLLACDSPLPSGRGDAAPQEPDAEVGSDSAVAIVLSESSLTLSLGEASSLTAHLVDALGFEVASGPPVWTVTDPLLASVSSLGEVKAMRPGVTSITATIGTFEQSLPLSVSDGDLSQCCIDAGEVSGFCQAPVGTATCPMTMPGGYCDPDGDGAYDAMSDTSFGTTHYDQVCIDGCNNLGCGCGNPAPQEVCELVDTNNCHDVPISTTCAGGVDVACAPAQDVGCTEVGLNVGDTYPVGRNCTCLYQRQRKQVEQCSSECL